MTRVFHLITHFDLGGAERVAANIAASSTDDMEYHVVEILRGNSAYTPQFLHELRGHGVRCHRSLLPDVHWHFVMERLAALLFPLRLLYLLLRYRPDVVHTHTETPDLSLFVAARLCPWLLRRVRIVRTIHNTRLWTGLARTAQWVERFFLSRNANIGISPSVCQAYQKRFGIYPPIIFNGVAEVEQHAYEGLPHDAINILFAGRLEEQKGVRVLCEVVRRIDATGRYHFVIAGDGSLRTLVEQTLAGTDTGMPLRNARLVAPIFGLSSVMTSFDYLFMPSEFEGLSMLSMEASMNGLPVVANRAPGLADTLPPDWPLMVNDNSIAAYMHLFDSVLPTISRQELVAKARTYAASRFSIRHMQQEYERVYNRPVKC